MSYLQANIDVGLCCLNMMYQHYILHKLFYQHVLGYWSKETNLVKNSKASAKASLHWPNLHYTITMANIAAYIWSCTQMYQWYCHFLNCGALAVLKSCIPIARFIIFNWQPLKDFSKCTKNILNLNCRSWVKIYMYDLHNFSSH